MLGIIQIQCPCKRPVSVRLKIQKDMDTDEKTVTCWTCMRDYRCVLYKSGQMSVHKREFMAYEFEPDRYVNVKVTYSERGT